MKAWENKNKLEFTTVTASSIPTHRHITKTTETMAETTGAKKTAKTTTHVDHHGIMADHPEVAPVETFTKHDVNCACSRFTEKQLFTPTLIAIMISHFLL